MDELSNLACFELAVTSPETASATAFDVRSAFPVSVYAFHVTLSMTVLVKQDLFTSLDMLHCFRILSYIGTKL